MGMIKATQLTLRYHGDTWRMRCVISPDTQVYSGTMIEISLATRDLREALARAEVIRRAYITAHLITRDARVQLANKDKMQLRSLSCSPTCSGATSYHAPTGVIRWVEHPNTSVTWLPLEETPTPGTLPSCNPNN